MCLDWLNYKLLADNAKTLFNLYNKEPEAGGAKIL